jgi:hypothetical protein
MIRRNVCLFVAVEVVIAGRCCTKGSGSTFLMEMACHRREFALKLADDDGDLMQRDGLTVD